MPQGGGFYQSDSQTYEFPLSTPPEERTVPPPKPGFVRQSRTWKTDERAGKVFCTVYDLESPNPPDPVAPSDP